MHKAAWDFVESAKASDPGVFKGKRVLEVGSRYINGTVRTLFEGCDYTGIDLSKGPLVDIVCHVKDYSAEPFDTIISCEALEHDKDWKESVKAMLALLKPMGTLIVTAGGTGRPEHGTARTSPGDSPATTDYYGNIGKVEFLEAIGGDIFALRIEDIDGDFRFYGSSL